MDRTSIKRRRRFLRAVPVTIAAVGLTVAGPTAWLSAASAAGGLSTSTSVTASPSTSAVGQSVTLTATVGITALGGAGITPTGTVTFSTGGTTLGTAHLGTCVLKACTASLATTALPRGTDTVLASYPGDGFTAASSGTTSVTVNQVATPAAPYDQTCAKGQPCDTGTLYADDGSATLDVAATASNQGSDTIDAYLGGSTLPCSTPGAGESGNYTVSATDVTKTITYSLFGTSADAFNNAHPMQPPPHVCYLATLPFAGYYPNNGHWTGTSSDYVFRSSVPYNSTLGGYVGLLPACNSQKSNAPCVVSQTFSAGGSGGQDKVVFVLYEAFKQRCDPHVTG